MRYSVIYSVDCPGPDFDHIGNYEPNLHAENEDGEKVWAQTEGDEDFDAPYEGEIWEKGQHRKWVAILTEEQFEEFLAATHIYCDKDECSTLGSPGFGLSLTKALSFTGSNDEFVQHAAVTPFADDVAGLIQFFRDNDRPVPAKLVDVRGQRYLWKNCVDKRDPWTALADTMMEMYS